MGVYWNPIDDAAGVVSALANTDYANGWTRALTDGNPLALFPAPVDVLGGVHLLTTAGSDVAGFLGLGGDSTFDKEVELAVVGKADPALIKANDAEQDNGRARLQQIKATLSAKDPSAFATADEILDPGSAGMHYFDYFLPAYNAWTGQRVTIDAIRQGYDRERGMNFTAYTADARLLTAAAGATSNITAHLQSAYNALVPTWQGGAAAKFESAMTSYFTGDQGVSDTLSKAGSGLAALVAAIEHLVYTKASTVSGLYADTLAPGIDGVQALQTVVAVAQNRCHDPQRRWVLATFGQPIHGRHMTDSDGMYSLDDLDDPSRELSQQVAAEWCNRVLVAQTEQRLRIFDQVCTTTTTQIQQLFAQFATDAKSVKNPFAGMPTSLAIGTDGGGGAGSGGGTGGGDGSGGGTVGGAASGGGSGGASGGGSGGASRGGSGAGGGQTFPMNVDPGGPGSGPSGIGAAAGGASPVVSGVCGSGIVTNPDATVSIGPDQDLTIGNDKSGRDFTVSQNVDGSAQGYQVTYDANGHPHVEQIAPGVGVQPVAPGSDQSVSPAAVLPTGSGAGGGSGGGSAVGVGVGGASGSGVGVGSGDSGGGDATSTQMGVGTQFGAVDPTSTAGAASLPEAGAGGAAAPSGAAPGGSGMGGMPMMGMGGMGKGSGGGDQELRRRYTMPADGVVDDEELEEWDRLGPTIG